MVHYDNLGVMNPRGILKAMYKTDSQKYWKAVRAWRGLMKTPLQMAPEDFERQRGTLARLEKIKGDLERLTRLHGVFTYRVNRATFTFNNPKDVEETIEHLRAELINYDFSKTRIIEP